LKTEWEVLAGSKETHWSKWTKKAMSSAFYMAVKCRGMSLTKGKH